MKNNVCSYRLYYASILSSHEKLMEKNIYKCLTISSVLKEPLYSTFLFTVIYSSMQYALEELGINNEFTELTFLMLAVLLAFLSLSNDMLAVNPIEEAEELSHTVKDSKQSTEAEELTLPQRTAANILTGFNNIIANATYVVGSSSNLIPLALLGFSFSSRLGICIGAGIPIITLSVVYYNMLTKAKINRHAREYVKRLLTFKESIIINALKTPLKSIEILIQTLTNAFYRGAV